MTSEDRKEKQGREGGWKGVGKENGTLKGGRGEEGGREGRKEGGKERKDGRTDSLGGRPRRRDLHVFRCSKT
jgi:hypothetical protein